MDGICTVQAHPITSSVGVNQVASSNSRLFWMHNQMLTACEYDCSTRKFIAGNRAFLSAGLPALWPQSWRTQVSVAVRGRLADDVVGALTQRIIAPVQEEPHMLSMTIQSPSISQTHHCHQSP
jgi:hypothetical protein